MLSRSILKRESDGKLFKPVYLSHWSEIRSDDGETDHVKLYGPALYVSATQGHGYVDLTDKDYHGVDKL